MKSYLKLLMLTLLCVFISSNVYAQIGDVERSTPEKEGIPSENITSLIDSLMNLPNTDIHSLIISRNGKIIVDFYPRPFGPEYRHTLYSCSKTFVAAAVGIAIHENKLRIDDRIANFFVDQLPAKISKELAQITVKDLLTMRSGIAPDWDIRNRCDNWTQTFLNNEVTNPGTKFQYDSMCSYLLSAIVQKVTGTTVLNYLKKNLFNPMHITDVYWELSPEGINTGGWGLHIQSESLIKFGNLLLNKGVWNGQQLLEEKWVEEMMNCHVTTGGDGYGYQMWMCNQYKGSARADGAYGQYIIVIPNYNIVAVLTECSHIDGNNQRNLIFNSLLSHAKDSCIHHKTPKKFYDSLGKYSLPLAKGKRKSDLISKIDNKKIKLEKNPLGWEYITFYFGKNIISTKIENLLGESFNLNFSYNSWEKSQTYVYPPYSINAHNRFDGLLKEFVVFGNYAWNSSSSLHLKAYWVNWISALNIEVQFNKQDVKFTIKANYESESYTISAKIVE